MKNTIKFGTLIMVVLITLLCVLILLILTFTTAATDKRMAERYANSVTEVYKLETLGQNWVRKKINEADKTGLQEASVTIGEEGKRNLRIVIEPDKNGYKIVEWSLKPQELSKQGITNLFKGE